MKQNEDNTKPDPRQILNDIAAREAEAAAGDTVKTAKGSGDDDGTDRTEPTQKGDGNAKDTLKQAAAKGNGGNGTADSFLSIIRGQAEENETGNVSDLSLAKVIGGDINHDGRIDENDFTSYLNYCGAHQCRRPADEPAHRHHGGLYLRWLVHHRYG